MAAREPFLKDASVLFSLADKGKIYLTISSLTLANTHYILSKIKSPAEARTILRKFKILVEILPLNDKIIELALNDEDFPDFEDGLQYYTALENNQHIIITRNPKDFKKSRIPVLKPKEILIKQNQKF